MNQVMKVAVVVGGLLSALSVSAGNDLPALYSRLEAVESSGTQYVDTGYAPSAKTSFVAEILGAYTAVPTGYQLMGNLPSDTDPRYDFGCHRTIKWTMGRVIASTAAVDAEEHLLVADFGAGTLSVDGTNVLSGVVNTKESPNYNFFLFARRNKNSSTPDCASKFRLRYCRLFQGGVLVRDLVPAKRTSDNVVGLFDLVESRFYAPGGGALGGCNYVPNLRLNYIETDGTQYINTGYKALGSSAFSFELKGGWTQVRTSYQLFGSLEDGTARYDFGMHKNKVWTLGAGVSSVVADALEHVFTGRFESPSNTMAVDGTTVLTDGKPLLANATREFYLFNRQNKNGGVSCPSWFRLRSCKLMQGGTVVRDFVPGLTMSGIAGVWDLANANKHYPKNAGNDFRWGYAYLPKANGEIVHVGTLVPADMSPSRDFEKDGEATVSAGEITQFPAALTFTRGELSFADGTARTSEVVGALTFKGGAAMRIDVTASACDQFRAGALVFDATATADNPVIVNVNDIDAQKALPAGTRLPFLNVPGQTLTDAEAGKFRVRGMKAYVAAENGVLVLRDVPVSSAEWTGAAGDGLWSTAGNWLNDALPQYGSSIHFPVAAGGATTMDIPGLVAASIDVDSNAGAFLHGGTSLLAVEGALTNNSTKAQTFILPMELGYPGDPFIFAGSGDLVLTGGVKKAISPILVKAGSGLVHINDEVVAQATNVTIEAGILRLERTVRVTDRSAGGVITICPGAQLDVNVYNNGNVLSSNEATHGKTVHVAGSGPAGSKGALDNSSAKSGWGCNFSKVVLDADATVGGGWMAIRDLTGSAQSGSALEGAYTLTVRSDNMFLLHACKVALDRLDLRGVMSFEGTASGAITNGVHCFSDGLLQFTNTTVPNTIPLTVEENGAVLKCSGGNATMAGAVIVKPGVETTVQCQTNLTLSGEVSNSGVVSQTGPGMLALTGGLSGNGSFVGERVHFGGAESRWEIEVDDAGTTSMVDFSGVTDSTLFVGLKALSVRATGTSTALQAVELASAGELTQAQAVAIALTVVNAQGDPVPNCHLDVVADKLVLTLRDVNLVRTAVWTGEGTDPMNLAEPANWCCRNDLGQTLEGRLPIEHTTIEITGGCEFNCPAGSTLAFLNVRWTAGASLGADCDWSGLDLSRILPEGTLDLAGHNLRVTARTNLDTAFTVTDSTERGGSLYIAVPEGLTVLNNALALTGSLHLVTTGAGTFDARKFGQTYTGGTEVAGGTLTLQQSGSTSGTYSPKNGQFGAENSEIVVDVGAMFDTRGNYDFKRHRIVLNGGTWANRGCDMSKRPSDGYGCTGGLLLTADSSLLCNFNTRHGEGVIDLGGHVLDVTIASGKYWHLDGASTVSNGTLRVTGGGFFNTLAIVKEARTVNVVMDTAMSLNTEARISFNDFAMSYTGTNRGSGKGGVDIYGTYTPVTDYTYDYILQNQATINLEDKETTWDVTGLQLGFVANSNIGILLPPPNRVKSGDYVISWEEGKAPANAETVTFTAKGQFGAHLQFTSTGIIVRRGLAIILR